MRLGERNNMKQQPKPKNRWTRTGGWAQIGREDKNGHPLELRATDPATILEKRFTNNSE